MFSSLVFAREGIVILKNGHTLSGDISKLPKGQISVSRLGSLIKFSKNEIARIQYNKKSLVEKKTEVDDFLKLLKAVPDYKKPKSERFDSLISKASEKEGLDSLLIKAVVEVESGFDPKGLSCKGAQGLMQLMPSTARSLGIKNAYDPAENIKGGSRYLRKMLDLFDGDIKLALAAYNAGPNAVKKYGRIPPYRETQRYVKKVLNCYENNKDAFNKIQADFYEYKDQKGCLYLSNYRKNRNYQPFTRKQ